MSKQSKTGFTLVELLVVMAIISVLIAMTLPAVQYSREAGRRVKCLNNLKQLQLAVINYESANRQFPPGAMGSGAIWSAFVLPFMEEQSLYDAVTVDDFTESETNTFGTRHWFLPRNNDNEDVILGDVDPIRRNLAAIRQHVTLFRCPSASSSEFASGTGVAAVGPLLQFQPNYVASGSHVLIEDDDPRIHESPHLVFSGAFAYGHGLEARQFVDGLSKTVFLGELDDASRTITAELCQRFETSNACRRCDGHCIGAARDHAFLGSDDIDVGTDFSEFFCSTAVPLESVRNVVPCEPGRARCTTHKPIEQLELMFNAPHRVVHFSFGDGSVRPIGKNIAPSVFQGLGSRYGSETNSRVDD